jgi:hypothetical protein
MEMHHTYLYGIIEASTPPKIEFMCLYNLCKLMKQHETSLLWAILIVAHNDVSAQNISFISSS